MTKKYFNNILLSIVFCSIVAFGTIGIDKLTVMYNKAPCLFMFSLWVIFPAVACIFTVFYDLGVMFYLMIFKK